jgi:hypothetical protein
MAVSLKRITCSASQIQPLLAMPIEAYIFYYAYLIPLTSKIAFITSNQCTYIKYGSDYVLFMMALSIFATGYY